MVNSLYFDLDELLYRVCKVYEFSDDGFYNLLKIRDKLTRLFEKGIVKSNHSIIEFILASYLISKGFRVDVEHEVERDVVCDVYAEVDGERVIVEVETGYVPPENCLDPLTYRMIRAVSKIVRYSRYSDKFYLAYPPYHIEPIPSVMLISYNDKVKRVHDLKRVLGLCSKYYRNVRWTLDDILKAHIEGIIYVNVDNLNVKVIGVDEYLKILYEVMERLGLTF